MKSDRLEAFSDGVLAIIITIMVLELSIPEAASLSSLVAILPNFLAYVLSYTYIGIYWVNHHHLISMVDQVSGKLLWKNLFWIFCISLIPMSTKWVGLNLFESLPTLFYGLVLLLSSIGYYLLQREVIKTNKGTEEIIKNLGNNFKAKLSIAAYLVACLTSISLTGISYVIYVLVAVIWIIPSLKLDKFKDFDKRGNRD